MTPASLGRSRLSIDAAVRLDRGPARVTLSGAGATLVARSRDTRSLRELLSAGPGSAWRRGSAARLHAGLERAGLSLDLCLGNRRVARLGSRARPTLAARLAGVRGAQLGWLVLALALQAAVAARIRRHASG